MPEAASSLDGLVDRFFDHHRHFHPVDASFMGLAGDDHRLPPADADTPARERESLSALGSALDRVAIADTSAARIEARMLRAALMHAGAALDHRPRFRQPTWYTGETAFGLISLLLPSAPLGASEALEARLAAVPDFLDSGIRNPIGAPTPADWCERARREAAAIIRLLSHGLPRHDLWRDALAPLAQAASDALTRFAAALDELPPADPACGRDYLAILMRDIHGLPWSPEEALALAEDAFARLGDELEAASRRIDRAHGAQEQLDVLATKKPDDVAGAYRFWHARAIERSDLVTPARDYRLDFPLLPDWARAVAGDLYFLSYRSPPAFNAGAGSVYWVNPPSGQSEVAIKQVHAVHHGSVGHHTQNARARVAGSRLARVAGTDCASGIAFLSAGTMVEGWACYATEMMAEVDGFYTPAEKLALIHGDRRNAASVLADIRLHSGAWSLEQMREFYRDRAGFPPARVWSETTRNSIFPATRLMYFLGTEQIKSLRRELAMPDRDFHDALISFGHVPIAWVAAEMRDHAKRSRGASAPGQ